MNYLITPPRFLKRLLPEWGSTVAHLTKNQASLGAIISIVVMFSCVGLLTSKAWSSVPEQHEMAQHALEPALTTDQILITMPVFISSIIGAVFFTWTVACYANKRDKMMDKMATEMETIQTELAATKRELATKA